MVLTSGTKLGPYELSDAIGAGGMGEVYRARDPRLNRDVAVKILPASFSSDRERLHRFEQEARAAASLNHPNILAVYDIGTQDGSPYIVSELLEGESLRERLRSGPLSLRKASDYALQIARGLAAAHDKGIVHRDLKPDNIFITRDGRVKLLDFGLAKLTQAAPTLGDSETRTIQSEVGTVLGTMGYMSPEQVRGKAADERSDLFAFGAVLYEMISGKRAFHGETAADTISAILHTEPPELTETNRNVPPALDRIVRHCLEKNPEERFHSAHDVAFDLETLTSISSSTVATRAVAKITHRRTMVAVIALAVLVGTATFFGG
jgi:serine/threonine protein kinase